MRSYIAARKPRGVGMRGPHRERVVGLAVGGALKDSRGDSVGGWKIIADTPPSGWTHSGARRVAESPLDLQQRLRRGTRQQPLHAQQHVFADH